MSKHVSHQWCVTELRVKTSRDKVACVCGCVCVWVWVRVGVGVGVGVRVRVRVRVRVGVGVGVRVCVCVNHLNRCKTSNLAGGWSVLQMSPSNEDASVAQ